MLPKDETINYDFIRTLEIEDILLMESNHKVYAMYVEGTPLELQIGNPDKTNVIVTEQYVIFELSVEIKVHIESEEEEKTLILESSAKFGAIYKYANLDNWDDDAITNFAGTFFRFSAITHILAFAREHFFTQMIKSGYPRLHIPLIKSLLDEDGEEEASKELSTTK